MNVSEFIMNGQRDPHPFAALAQLVERGAYRFVSIKRQNAKVAGSRPASSIVLRIQRILKTVEAK